MDNSSATLFNNFFDDDKSDYGEAEWEGADGEEGGHDLTEQYAEEIDAYERNYEFTSGAIFAQCEVTSWQEYGGEPGNEPILSPYVSIRIELDDYVDVSDWPTDWKDRRSVENAMGEVFTDFGIEEVMLDGNHVDVRLELYDINHPDDWNYVLGELKYIDDDFETYKARAFAELQKSGAISLPKEMSMYGDVGAGGYKDRFQNIQLEADDGEINFTSTSIPLNIDGMMSGGIHDKDRRYELLSSSMWKEMKSIADQSLKEWVNTKFSQEESAESRQQSMWDKDRLPKFQLNDMGCYISLGGQFSAEQMIRVYFSVKAFDSEAQNQALRLAHLIDNNLDEVFQYIQNQISSWVAQNASPMKPQSNEDIHPRSFNNWDTYRAFELTPLGKETKDFKGWQEYYTEQGIGNHGSNM
jgi:hypothetical protein